MFFHKDRPAGFKQIAHAAHKSRGVVDMLDHVAEVDDVERGIRKGRGVQDAVMNFQAPHLPRVVGGRGADLHTGRFPASGPHFLQEPARGAADIQKGFTGWCLRFELRKPGISQAKHHQFEKILLIGELVLVILLGVAVQDVGSDRLRVLVQHPATSAALKAVGAAVPEGPVRRLSAKSADYRLKRFARGGGGECFHGRSPYTRIVRSETTPAASTARRANVFKPTFTKILSRV